MKSSSLGSAPPQGAFPFPPLIFWGGAGFLVFAAAGIRLWASLNDFWLDEIWSLTLAASLGSPLEILTKLKQDNNHHLNTFFLYLWGDQQHLWLYRRPREVQDFSSNIYTLARVFPSGGLSGTPWFLYHNRNRAPTPVPASGAP